jgi:hypothetical protein
MKRSIVYLVLFLMSGGLSRSQAQEPGPTSLVPTPETARLVLATEDWLVWATSSVVPGTERYRAVFYRMRFYLNHNAAESAHFVYETVTTGGHPFAGVLQDGTLVLTKGGYTGEILLVKPDGTKVEIAPPKGSTEFGRHGPIVSQVFDDGVLMQAYNLDLQGEGPVYFVPWSSEGVDFNKKLLVTDQKGVLIGAATRAEDNVISLSRTTLQVFNLTTRKRADYPAKELVDAFDWEHPKLQAADAETLVFRSVRMNRLPVTPVFDLKTGKFDYKGYIPARVIAVKDRIVYTMAQRPAEKAGLIQHFLGAIDLDSTAREHQSLMDIGYDTDITYIVRKDGFWIWIDKEWKRVPWLSKEAK